MHKFNITWIIIHTFIFVHFQCIFCFYIRSSYHFVWMRKNFSAPLFINRIKRNAIKTSMPYQCDGKKAVKIEWKWRKKFIVSHLIHIKNPYNNLTISKYIVHSVHNKSVVENRHTTPHACMHANTLWLPFIERSSQYKKSFVNY